VKARLFAILLGIGLATAAQPASAEIGVITGSLPSQGGFALIVWGGGSTNQLVSAAAAGECTLASAWTIPPGESEFVGYIDGAPAFVNQRFFERYPTLPAQTSMVLVCSPRSVSLPPPLPFNTLSGQPMTSDMLDGKAFLLDGNGVYLGLISSSKASAESVCNASGQFGSLTSSTSVRNKTSVYGRPGNDPYTSSLLSAYNLDATNPPRVFFAGSHIAYLTKSQAYPSGAIDPDRLFAALGCPY
jgi:hypothetical protein